MKKSVSALGVMGFFLIATWGQQISGQSTTSAQAGTQNANPVCRVYFTKVKPGSESQWEEARKRHVAFHKQHNDTWTWEASQVVTGDNMGEYVVSTCGHSWKDFDDWEKKMGKEDAADAMAGMGPLEQSNTNSFYTFRADLSRAPANGPSMPMSSVTVFQLRPGSVDNFIGAVKKINAALEKQPSIPRASLWLQLSNGGEMPMMVVVSERQGWADYAPREKTFRDAVTEAYGKEEADATFRTMSDSEAHVYTESSVARPDLSYSPK